MNCPLVPIGNHTEKIKSWNPANSLVNNAFDYIDLASVDKDKKTISLASVPNILPIDAPSRARQLVKESDVLVATVRPNLNGVALVQEELDGATASTGYSVLRADEKYLNSKYLYYWVQTSLFVTDMISKATGANYPAISDRIIKESKIPLPSLKEQKRIATILDKADNLRQKRQQAIQLADELLRSVFLEMFGDPVTNPKGWNCVPAKKLLVIQGGYAFKSSSFVKQGIPVVKIGNANKVGFTVKDIDFVKPENEEKLLQYELKPGDLLMSLTGTVGKDDYGNITEVSNSWLFSALLSQI